LWVDIEGVKNGNITFVLDIKVDTPVITCRLFLISFVGIVVIDKELEIAVDKSRDRPTAGSVEFHGFDLIFVVGDTDFDFFAGNGAIDFICKGLFECSRSERFPEVGDECKGKWENLMRVEDELGFALLHAS
jgi:hypothetical protein